MTEDERLAQFGERLAIVETNAAHIKDTLFATRKDMIETAAAAGRASAISYNEGLRESFIKDTDDRLHKLEETVNLLKGRAVLIGAILVVLSFVAGQKVPPIIP